jgi:hypothetical protein
VQLLGCRWIITSTSYGSLRRKESCFNALLVKWLEEEYPDLKIT